MNVILFNLLDRILKFILVDTVTCVIESEFSLSDVCQLARVVDLMAGRGKSSFITNENTTQGSEMQNFVMAYLRASKKMFPQDAFLSALHVGPSWLPVQFRYYYASDDGFLLSRRRRPRPAGLNKDLCQTMRGGGSAESKGQLPNQILGSRKPRHKLVVSLLARCEHEADGGRDHRQRSNKNSKNGKDLRVCAYCRGQI